MSKTFCPLPWIHIATRPNGDVRLCCTANASGAGAQDEKEIGLIKKDGINMNLRDHSLEEVWNSDYMKETRLTILNNEIPKSCKKCFEEESRGIKSKRNWETEIWKDRIDIDEIVSRTSDDGSLPLDIPYFDLRLGNVCNLKCIMCSPHDSSNWIKDWKLQYPKYKTIDLRQDQNWDSSFDYTWYKKGSFLDAMKDQAKNIKELYFAGGEPLMIPEHYSILEFMIDQGHAQNCILRYNSNGTTVSEKLIFLWEKFKQVKFNFSIDAVGEKNDYIRYPSRWKDIVKTLHLLDETSDRITINIACAVQLLNISNIADLAQWKIDQNFKKINKMPYGAGVIGLHLVYLPSYLNVRVLPQEFKNQAANTISKFVDSISTKEFHNDFYGRKRWLGLVDYMNSEDWSHKLSSTVEYLNVCDQTRGLNFRKIFTELKDL